jgi:hypothetical protein
MAQLAEGATIKANTRKGILACWDALESARKVVGKKKKHHITRGPF